MEQVILHTDSCKGCYYCIDACPKKAISLSGEFNAKGYQTTTVDNELCVCCGGCYTVCPDYVYEIVDISEERSE